MAIKKKISRLIDFEHVVIGDPIYDLSKIIFNDLDFDTDLELRNEFFNGWKSVTGFDIPEQHLDLYLAIQGVGAVQRVDKQSLEHQAMHEGFRNKGIHILLRIIIGYD